MNRKSQTLIISIWVLLILTVLTVSIGHQVSMALRLSRYQKDRLKAIYLSKAGINRAIVMLENDKNNTSYDTPNEEWANNEEAFKKIMLNNNQDEFATVGYNIIDVNNQSRAIFGVVDEERKININTANHALLKALLESYGVAITDSESLSYNIRAWRGDTNTPLVPDDAKDYQALGYACKEKSFANIEELTLVKGITSEIYNKINDLITVYPVGGTLQINANTTTETVLTILVNSVALNPDEKNCVEAVAKDIIKQREEKSFFKTTADIEIRDVVSGTSSDENLYSNLKKQLITQSNNFLIEVTGNVSKIKSRVTAVYNRTAQKIIYWHES